MKLQSGWLCTIIVAVGVFAMLMVESPSSQAAEKKVTVTPAELPKSVKIAIKKAVPNGKIVKIQKEVEGEDPGQFDVDIRADGKLFEVEISPEGKVLEVKEVAPPKKTPAAGPVKEWTKNFGEEKCTFVTTGANPFFILKVGHQLVLESSSEKVVITVLDKTQKIGDVVTRVVEEREWEDGELKEVSRNFFAQCKEHGDVFYFGEEVDDYQDGKIVRHSGAWRADAKDSKAGIIMPGTILLGGRYYQELAPNAKDRAEIVFNRTTLKTPAGTFKNCLKVEETSALDVNERYFKTYAPGIGLIQDQDLLLTGWSGAKKK